MMNNDNRYESLKDAGYRFFNSIKARRTAGRIQPEIAGRQHIVYYFMGNSACSRCWKDAIALSRLYKQLRENDAAVVFVSDGHNQGPAARLAADLKLPFPLLVDSSNALRRRYGLMRPHSVCPIWSLSLVGKDGEIRHFQEGCSPEHKMNAFDLLAEIGRANTRNLSPEPFMPVTGCCVPL